MCCSPRSLRELDTTERLNNNDFNDNTPGQSQKIRVFRESAAAAGDEAQVYVLDLVTHFMCGSIFPHPTLIPSTIKSSS